MQNAKIIDIKRSFIPVDPNAFPETMHLDTREDTPEDRVPVVPYMGFNFLPTAHGYRSFFGTNSAIGIDTLLPNKADYIFIFQTLTYNNVLVALCDTGIWAKDAGSAGAWTQLVVMAAPAADVYYEWFYTTIKNKLYVYRANGGSFYEINTDIAEPLEILVTAKVPTFITPANQLGMFKVGTGRIGFWDANNAIAYSSPDDVTDFTPSVLTGANVTTFNTVLGRISAIRSHGKDAIVYATRSITRLAVEPSETFLLKATRILESGVPYARQSVESNPSSTHFAYTTTGIYKIENGLPEVIVPEIFDFFKTYTSQPVYLKLMQGRYLAFEVLDQTQFNGVPHFSKQSYDAATLTFPGFNSVSQLYQSDPADINMCEVLAQLNEGTFDETKAAANAQLPDKKPGTTATPIWTCYIASSGLKDISNLAWDSSPCGAVAYDGTVWHMTPDLAGSNRVDGMTTDGTNKTAVTGEEAYVDGIWTMERFIQYQTALWNAEEAVVAELNSEIATRAFSKTRTLNNQEGCVILNPAETVCEIGEFVSQFSPHYFGFNACSFWLTRFALETKEYATHSKTTRQCNDPGPSQLAHVGYVKISGGVRGSTVYGSPEAAMFSDGLPTDELRPELVTSLSVAGTIGYAKTHAIWCASCSPAQMYDTNWVEAKYVCTDGKTIVSSVDGANGTPPTVYEQYIAGHVDLIDTSYANNQVAATNAGVLGVETAWCEITGWQYTNNAGETVTAAATSCTDMGNNYPGSADPTAAVARTANPAASYPLLIDAQGIVCDVEFVPAINGDVSWPSQDLTYAGLTFLLQDGSISPKYPTIYGAYVYDLHLKKWGKYKGPYKGLLDYSPVNSESSSVISSNNFGILAGAWKDDGFIYLFDDRPVDSELTWGKVGYYRRGMSDIQEVKFNFKTKATGSISVDLSLDGRAISEPSNFEETHTDVYNKTVYPPYSGKWFNVTIKGQYDVSGLTIVGGRKGQR